MSEPFAPQFIKNVTKDVAEINLFDEVGEGGISGQSFADEMQMLVDFGVKEINININSPGGSIMDGFSIFHAITNSEATVNTHIVGVAASMAGIFALAGDHITIVDFGQVMLHDPLISSNGKKIEDLTPEQEKALNAMRASLLMILKNRTNKTEKELSEMLKAETWLNAKEALEGGFVDEIVSSKHTPKERRKRQPVAEITNILQSITNTSNTEKMKELCKYLNLSEDASEQAILEAVRKIDDKLTEVKSTLETKETELVDANKEIETQKEEITTFKDAQSKLNKTLVDETIDEAIKEGKFEEKDKEELTEQFENNLTGLKMIVGKLKTPAEIISDKLEGGDGNTEVPEARKDWSLIEWEKKDQVGIDKIRNENPKLYAKMHLAEYGVEYVAV